MTRKPRVSTTDPDPRPQSERSEATSSSSQRSDHPEPDAAPCPCCGRPQPQPTLDPAASEGPEPDATACPFCRALMRKGILLIEVEDWGGGPPGEPRRTGRVACVDESGIRRCVRPLELVEQTLRKRYAFVSQAAWKSFGLAGVGEGEVN